MSALNCAQGFGGGVRWRCDDDDDDDDDDDVCVCVCVNVCVSVCVRVCVCANLFTMKVNFDQSKSSEYYK